MPFCPQCGTNLGSTATQPAKFCTNCGAKIDIAAGPISAVVSPSFDTFVQKTDLGPVATAIGAEAIPVEVYGAQVGTPVVSGGLPNVTSTVQPDGNPGMVLVAKGSPHALHFAHATSLRQGGPAVPADLTGPHRGQNLGRAYTEERHHEEWRYTESRLGPNAAVHIKLEEGGFISIEGADLVLDVAFWNMLEGVPVNFVGGHSRSRTRLRGEGRCFKVNEDDTISPTSSPHLVLGAGVLISAEELEGCYTCCCYPIGTATYKLTAESENSFTECGIFFLFFVAPIPFFKRRVRAINNRFHNTANHDDNASFRGPGVYDHGPLQSCSGGGRW